MVAAAPSSSEPAPRQMSWAERAKASTSRQTEVAKSVSPTPSNASTMPSHMSSALSESVRSSSSGIQQNGESSAHKRSSSDFATTAPAAPPPAEVPSATVEEVTMPSPTKAPPVNVWKERMAAAATQMHQASTSAPASAVNNTAVAAKPVERAVAANGKQSGRGRAPGPSQPAPPALNDTSNWPNPLDAEKTKSVGEAVHKTRTTDTSPSATSSRSSGGQDTSKGKKTKWMPIEADITIDGPLPTRYIREGEKSRASTRSHSRDTAVSRSSRGADSSVPRDARQENSPVQVGLSAWPAQQTPSASRSSPLLPTPMNLPTSLPAKPLGGEMPAYAPSGPMAMRAGSPRINGLSNSPGGSVRSPSSPTVPLSRSMSASPGNRSVLFPGSPPLQPSSRMDHNHLIRAESNAFVPNRGNAFTSQRGRGSNVRGDPPRGGSPRIAQGSNMPRGGGRGAPIRGARGGVFQNGTSPHQMAQPMFFDSGFGPYGYMPPMPFAPVPPQFQLPNQQQQQQQQQQQPFNMLPMMNVLPPQPVKTDFDPPLDTTRLFLLGQVEFYVSPNNLAKDLFLRQQMDVEGWIDLKTILTFKRIQALTLSLDLLRDTVTLSPILDVDYEGYKFRPKYDWAKWIMPNAKAAVRRAEADGPTLIEHDDANKSLSNSASEDGEATSGTTGMTSPSLSSASQTEETSPKIEAPSAT